MQDTESNKQSLTSRPVATALCLVAAVLAPLVVITLFSYYDNSHYETPWAGAMLVFLAAVACGGFFICMLPFRRPVRLVCLCIYVPVAIVGLFFYSLYFSVEVLHESIM